MARPRDAVMFIRVDSWHSRLRKHATSESTPPLPAGSRMCYTRGRRV